MCTKKTLYSAGTNPTITVSSRKRGEKLDFEQICFTTECLRKYAIRRDMPMVEAIGELRGMKAFPVVYRAAREIPRMSSQKVVNSLFRLKASV